MSPLQGKFFFNGWITGVEACTGYNPTFGIVLQTPFCSQARSRAISAGKLDATDEEVIAAAKAVNLHDILMQMGRRRHYDTEIRRGQ